MRDLLDAGVHFGHQTRRWNPKMAPYLFGAKAGIHIIDLEKTAHALNRSLAAISQMVSEGKQVLFVSTKAQTKEILPQIVAETGMPYMTSRWPGGFLTNFQTMKRRIQHRITLEKELSDETARKRFTKKELLMKSRELQKLDILFAGTKNMLQLPEAVFVVDTVHDRIAVLEAKKRKLPIFALADSNSDPSDITFPIPANDDAVKSIRLMLELVAEAIRDGSARKATVAAAVATAAKPATPKDALVVPEEVLAEKGDVEAPVKKAPAKKAAKPVS